MEIKFNSIYSFNNFKQDVKTNLSSREKRVISLPGFRESSVMMLFMEKENSPHVILTLRTDKVSTHKGQISFPGGGHDKEDRDYLETAIRETFEEIGIDPAQIEVLGEFDEYVSTTGFHVHVYAGALNSVIRYLPSEDEIEDILEVPFSIFYNEEFERREIVNYEGRDYTVYYYKYGKNTIWGLTSRILTDFSRKICR